MGAENDTLNLYPGQCTSKFDRSVALCRGSSGGFNRFDIVFNDDNGLFRVRVGIHRAQGRFAEFLTPDNRRVRRVRRTLTFRHALSRGLLQFVNDISYDVFTSGDQYRRRDCEHRRNKSAMILENGSYV